MTPRQPPPRLEHMTEPELRDVMQNLAKVLSAQLKNRTSVEVPLFVLLVFDDPALVHYVSSCERGTVKEAMTELLARWGKPDEETRHTSPHEETPRLTAAQRAVKRLGLTVSPSETAVDALVREIDRLNGIFDRF